MLLSAESVDGLRPWEVPTNHHDATDAASRSNPNPNPNEQVHNLLISERKLQMFVVTSGVQRVLAGIHLHFLF